MLPLSPDNDDRDPRILVLCEPPPDTGLAFVAGLVLGLILGGVIIWLALH
jgi:hypothetical protein